MVVCLGGGGSSQLVFIYLCPCFVLIYSSSISISPCRSLGHIFYYLPLALVPFNAHVCPFTTFSSQNTFIPHQTTVPQLTVHVFLYLFVLCTTQLFVNHNPQLPFFYTHIKSINHFISSTTKQNILLHENLWVCSFCYVCFELCLYLVF